MDLTGYGLLAALAAFMLFVWGHAIGYAQGHEDGVREQERHANYGAASDAMEPMTEAQPALSWIDKLEQEINGK